MTMKSSTPLTSPGADVAAQHHSCCCKINGAQPSSVCKRMNQLVLFNFLLKSSLWLTSLIFFSLLRYFSHLSCISFCAGVTRRLVTNARSPLSARRQKDKKKKEVMKICSLNFAKHKNQFAILISVNHMHRFSNSTLFIFSPH